MKTALSMAALGLVLVGAAGRAADPGATARIAWEGQVFPAFEKAVKEKKYLAVYFHKDFCDACQGPCHHCGPVSDILCGEAAGALTPALPAQPAIIEIAVKMSAFFIYVPGSVDLPTGQLGKGSALY